MLSNRKRLLVTFMIFFPILLCQIQCNQTSELTKGKAIYKAYCVNCHGIEGNLGANAAMDLSRSGLSLEGRKEIIRHGRVTMMGFDGVLSDAQIDSVAHYTRKLQK